jgi:hypothetical protein
MTAQEVYNEIVAYLAVHYGTDFIKSWYVGIASNVDDRLFSDRHVDRENGGWIWRQALNAEHARAAEAMLLERGHDGGPGGGDHSTTYVYAFRIEPGTVR